MSWWLPELLCRLVGGVLLFTAAAKSLDPVSFFRHLENLLAQRRWLVTTAVVAVIATESALGMALVMMIYPVWVLPASVLFLLVASGVTLWGTATGRTDDCGCYPAILGVRPWQSLLLNAAYVSILLLGICYSRPLSGIRAWQLGVVLATSVAAVVLGMAAARYALRFRRPLINFSPVRLNRRWNRAWLDFGADRLEQGEKLLVFLEPKCPRCQLWIKVLKTLHRQPNFPEMYVVVSDRLVQAEKFPQASGMTGPVIPITASRLARLIHWLPTGILLRDGVVQDLWVWSIPREFLDRFRSQAQAESSEREPDQDPAVVE